MMEIEKVLVQPYSIALNGPTLTTVSPQYSNNTKTTSADPNLLIQGKGPADVLFWLCLGINPTRPTVFTHRA